jgi:tetratricopeptide (TPR) repeat protein
MSNDSMFLLYALLFRAGIIAAGLYAMRLGQVLLREAQVRAGSPAEGQSSVEAVIPGVRFSLKNVTAGSIFALFGAVLIVAMVLQGNPEKTVQTQKPSGEVVQTETLRGGANDSIESVIESGKDAERSRALPEAERFYRNGLAKVAPAMNSLAWIYAQEGKADQGRGLSLAAVELDGDNAHYLDTLAEVEFRMGNKDLALQAMQKAAGMDPAFKARLADLRERTGK